MQAPERKRLMSLLSLLLLAVGAPVGAFQCNVPSVSYSNTQSSRYFLVTNAMDTRQKCFSCLHARYRYKHLAFLAAAEDSTTDESTDVAKESKRRRFAKAIRKIITYPKVSSYGLMILYH